MIKDIIAGVLSGILSSMGFGGGGILILYLSLYKNIPQLNAQWINLLFFIPSALLALIFHTRNKLVEWKLAAKMIIFGIIGAGTGYLILNQLDNNILKKIFSVIFILMGIKSLFSKDEKLINNESTKKYIIKCG